MAKVEEAFEIIQGMTILELRDLNKKIEEEFGDLLFVSMHQTFLVTEATEKGWRGESRQRTGCADIRRLQSPGNASRGFCLRGVPSTGVILGLGPRIQPSARSVSRRGSGERNSRVGVS